MICKTCNNDLPANRFQNSGNYTSSGAIKYKSICCTCGKIGEQKVKELRKKGIKEREKQRKKQKAVDEDTNIATTETDQEDTEVCN